MPTLTHKTFCGIRGCINKTDNPIHVKEPVGDGTWNLPVCEKCAKRLKLQDGQVLPRMRVLGVRDDWRPED